jgi:hypothetical protein
VLRRLGALFTREERGEILAGVSSITLDGVAFNPSLRFDGQRLTEVWLERMGGADTREWLDSRVPDWQSVFGWGTVDVEGEVGGGAIVLRFPAPAAEASSGAS